MIFQLPIQLQRNSFVKLFFYHLVGGVDNASRAAIVVYTWHRSAIQLKTNQTQGNADYLSFQVKEISPVALLLDTALGHIGIRLAQVPV